MNPQQPQPNNYDFIVNPEQNQNKLPSGNNSMAMRILIVLGGVFALVIIAVVLMSFLSNAGSSFNKAAMLSVAQDQTELIRLSEVGTQDGVSQRVKNFSITTKLSIQSEQASLQEYLQTAGYTIDPKQLPLKQDSSASSSLESAKSSSTFDSVYIETMQKKLQTYQADLEAAYDGASQEAKEQLSNRYDSAALLLAQLSSD